ncbi:MAG: methyltransferase domain-containing protein [Deltaproteobacteria bacterium]|nr:methyltransferase domain-containing protein [Deltaproteobacteria bacterium]
MSPASSLFGTAHAWLYILSQRAVGAHLARYACLEALAPRAGERIVDVGCGPAYYLGRLPAVDYHGFDTDQRHIAWARARFSGHASFYAEPFGEPHAARLAPVGGVLLLGLLHHLDDEQAEALLALLARALAPAGRVVTLDTPFFDGQSAVARSLARHDRGRYVRRPEQYRDLADRSFGRREDRIVGDTRRMPASHFMMVLREPRRSGPGLTR